MCLPLLRLCRKWTGRKEDLGFVEIELKLLMSREVEKVFVICSNLLIFSFCFSSTTDKGDNNGRKILG